MNLREHIDELVGSTLNPERRMREGDLIGEHRDARLVERYLEWWASRAYPDFSPFDYDPIGSMGQ